MLNGKEKKKKKQLSRTQQLGIAQRELEKGNAKLAVKHAKACHRLDPSESTRSLLQRALLSRGRDLHARALHDPARAVVVELDELGTVAAEYEADANRLRTLLGLRENVSGEELLEDEGLRAELADQAVLVGSGATQLGALADTAVAVRAALGAAEAGQHDQAIELVASIGRDSPFCDWKLLVRGLCAHYEGNDERASANWSRLASSRPARRIAETLSIISDSRRYADAPGVMRARADRLIRAIEMPLLSSLRGLQRLLYDSDCEPPELRAELRRFMHAYAKKEPAVAQRVAEIVVRHAIKREDEVELSALGRFLPKLPLDPNLNRASALCAAGQGELDLTERYWSAYVNDLLTCEVLNEPQKVIAAALVYARVAVHHVQAAEEAEDVADHGDDEYIDGLRQDAESYFRKSLEANLGLPRVHLGLGELLHQRGRHKEAAATFKELGRRFPDDADSLISVAQHFVRNNSPGVAKEYAAQARALRPRDTLVRSLFWASCLGTAREAAKRRQFRLAEAELDEAETLLDADFLDAYILHSLRAAVALKEGNQEAAEHHLEKTIEQFEQPTAALLLVDSQARRCKVAIKNIKSVLGDRLAKAFNGRKNAQAAGVMAKYLHALELNGIEYQGLVTHTGKIEKYLDKCSRVSWEADLLIDACRFAQSDPERRTLLEKLARRGISLFNNNPHFHFFLGRAEMASGPYRCNYRLAQISLQRAVDLDKSGDIPLEEQFRAAASHSLNLLEKGPPPSFSPHGPLGFGFDDDDEEEEEEDDGNDVGGHAGVLERLLETMPPDLRRNLAKLGLSPMAALRALVGRMEDDRG